MALGIRTWLRKQFMLRKKRSDYKNVWNFSAHSENAAKASVAGYTSEAEFDHTALGTVEMLKRYVGVKATDTILEIGAGVGRVGKHLAPLCKEWIGADVSENMVSYLKKRLAALPNVRGIAISGYDLAGVPSNSVDLVYCTVVFMHLDEWERFSYVREGLRVLRPGGRMIVDNTNLASPEGWQFFLNTMTDYKPTERPPNISKSSTPQELRIYFERAGFADIKQAEEGLWFFTWGVKPGIA